MKLNDIVSQKLLKKFEPLMAENSYMQKLDIVYAGEFMEDYGIKHSKAMVYQFKGTKRGFVVFCGLDETNKSLINKFDFHTIPEKQKGINGIEYNLFLDGLETEIDDKFARNLSKKYNLPYDVVLSCGDIEPFYKRLADGKIHIDSEKVDNLIKVGKLDKIIDLFEPKDREMLRSTLCDVNKDIECIELGEDIHPLAPLVEYIAKQQEVDLSLPKTMEEIEEYIESICDDEPEL